MDIHNLKIIQKNFINELTSANKNHKSSLPFIRHKLTTTSIVNDGEIFQTMVIGGSVYQKALMKKTDGKIEMISHLEGPQPQFSSKQILLEFLQEHVDPEVGVVALNFAYPMKPTNRDGVPDGTLVNGSKENTFDGLVGQRVGEEIEKFFKKNHDRDIKISAANDTICLLLSGLTKHAWDKLAAGVVGTGLNFAIFLDMDTVVNLESAEFDKFTQSEAGKIIDQASNALGSALFEKEVSGAYLYHHFNIEAKKRGLSVDKITNTKAIDDYAINSNAQIAHLAREILAQSAMLVTAQVSGILEFCGRDLTFIMQGSLFWKGKNYKDTVEKNVTELSPKYRATFEKIEHSDLYGAAKLVA